MIVVWNVDGRKLSEDLAHLKRVSGYRANRRAAEGLHMVRIAVGDGALRMCHRNFDVESSTQSAAVGSGPEISAVVHLGELASAVQRVGRGQVQIDPDDGAGRIALGGRDVTTSVRRYHGGDVLPWSPLPETAPLVTVDGAAFAAGVLGVVNSAGDDDTLPALTHILLEISGREVNVAATDRFSISCATIGALEDYSGSSLLVPGVKIRLSWCADPDEARRQPLLVTAPGATRMLMPTRLDGTNS